MKKAAVLGCAILVLFTACQSPLVSTPRQTAIATDARTYSPFDTVNVTATNIGADTLYGYGCSIELEIRTPPGSWNRASPQPAGIVASPCVGQLRRWTPGATWSVSVGLDGAKPGSVYRFRFDDLRNSTSLIDAADRVSATFSVQ